MHICFLSSKHPPFDKRVFDKEAVSLAASGFEVTHLAPGESNRQLKQGVVVVTYRHGKEIFSRLLLLPSLYRNAFRIDADCYHCNEMDSWTVGILLKFVKRSKVIFDVHEHYPSTFAEKRIFSKTGKTVVSWLVRVIIVLQSMFTDRIVFAKESVRGDFPLKKRKQFLVRNFTSLEYRGNKDVSISEQPIKSDPTTFTAIHFGLISRERGWPEVLKAMKTVRDTRLRLLVIGTFYDGTQKEFLDTAESYGLAKHVEVKEWMPFDKAWSYLLRSDVGLVTFQPYRLNFVYAFPHKLFDYMSAGLPVIVPSFAVEIAPIVKKVQCGMLVDTSRSDEIANALIMLLKDPYESKRLGERGKKAVSDIYNWENEARKLQEMYESLAS